MRTRELRKDHDVPELDRLDPVLDFMRLLWNLEHGLQSTSKWMETAIGITGPQRLTLRIVSQFPDLSAGHVARILHLHPSTVTGILQRLASKGLIARRRDPTDNRRVRLRARGAAPSYVRQSNGTVEYAVRRALARVPRERVRHAREVLTAVAEALDDDRQALVARSSRRR